MVLLVALPQSSSSAFQQSLANMSGLQYKYELPCDRYPNTSQYQLPPDHVFAPLAGETAHKDVCQLGWRTVRHWAHNRNTIYKQHVVPTLSNARNLFNRSRSPLVVLLRDPASSLRADCERLILNPKCNVHAKYGTAIATTCDRSSPPSYVQAAKQVPWRLRRAALDAFVKGWEDLAQREGRQRVLLLRYEHLRTDAARARALQHALAFLNLTQVRPYHRHFARYVNRSTDACATALASA